MLQTTEMVNKIAEITGGTKKDAKAHLDAFKTAVVDSLEAGQDVQLKGFVSFTSKEVAEHEARNPQNGETVVVPAHRRAKATLAETLRKW